MVTPRPWSPHPLPASMVTRTSLNPFCHLTLSGDLLPRSPGNREISQHVLGEPLPALCWALTRSPSGWCSALPPGQAPRPLAHGPPAPPHLPLNSCSPSALGPRLHLQCLLLTHGNTRFCCLFVFLGLRAYLGNARPPLISLRVSLLLLEVSFLSRACPLSRPHPCPPPPEPDSIQPRGDRCPPWRQHVPHRARTRTAGPILIRKS